MEWDWEPGESGAAPGRGCRCACGSLLARLVEGAVELKCRRCKRILLLPLAGGAPAPLERRVRPLPLGDPG